MQHEQIEQARRSLIQEILRDGLDAAGYDESYAPRWAKSARDFAGKLTIAERIPPQEVDGCQWYRNQIRATRAAALAMKLDRDRVMYQMLGGQPAELQIHDISDNIRGIRDAAGPGQIEVYLQPAQVEVVGLWRIWMRERDTLNALRDQMRALGERGRDGWAAVSGQGFPPPEVAGKVRASILRRWSS